MYSEPCARFTRFMMPKTSVRPAAIRNSITPSCSPLSVCSRTRTKFMPKTKGARSDRAPYRCRRPLLLSLHPAFLGVGILVVGEDRFLDLHHRILARRPGDRLQQVEILDREMVGVVAELAPRGGEVGPAHRGDHPLLVREIALHGAHRRIDQQDAVVALRSVEDGHLAEFLAVVRDVFLVRRIL